MKFAQKRLGTRIDLDFAATELTCSIRDKSGERDFTTDYAEIATGKRRVFDNKDWFRNVGVLWCIIGLASLGIDLYNNALGLWSGFWLVIGTGCLIYYAVSKSSFTLIDTQSGPIWILEDGQLQAIVSEIEKRRKERLYSLYGGIDLDADPNQEIGKIEWLVRQKVLTREEADRQIAQIRSNAAGALPAPDKLIN